MTETEAVVFIVDDDAPMRASRLRTSSGRLGFEPNSLPRLRSSCKASARTCLVAWFSMSGSRGLAGLICKGGQLKLASIFRLSSLPATAISR